MDRREFLKGTACLGALVATSGLPVHAEDNPKVFPERGKNERLSLSYATVAIGLPKPFSVLHISDTHLTAAYPHENKNKLYLHENRTKTFGGRQEEALKDSLDWARMNTDYVIHTGDLIDWQSEANYDLVRKYFGEAANGFAGAVGNHEFSPEMWLSDPKEAKTEEFKDLTRESLQKAYPYDICFQSQVVEGVNFITLDDVYGYVTEKQEALFHKEAEKGLPIVLCMHVPFYSDDIWRAHKRFWSHCNEPFRDATPDIDGEYRIQREDPVTNRFIQYLKTEPLLKAILAGHLHITIQDQFSPTARQFVIGGNFLFTAQEVLFR